MRSIQRHLTLWLLAGFALLTAAGGVAVYVAVRTALYAQFDAGLRVKALVVITSTEQRRGRIDVNFSDRFLREFDDDVATDFFQVWGMDGARNSERSDSLGKHDLPQRLGTMEEPEYWNLELPGSGAPGRAIGIAFTPRIDSDDDRTRRAPIQAGAVVAENRGDVDAMLDRLRWILVGAGGVLMLATSAAVPLALRPGLRPLRRLGDQAAEMSAASLARRFPVDHLPVELRPISERLNALLARLEKSFERERRFSADLAHELLTPLAELRAIMESALKWPETAGPHTHQQLLEILLRMENLVTRLLELCRAEDGRINTHPVPVDLPDLLRGGWRPFEEATRAKALDVKFEGDEPCEVITDPGLLRVIVGNLCSNAAEYAPPGSVVVVSWTVGGGEFSVRIANAAPRLSATDLPRMFDRFWRKDPARSDGQHSGLGLSVARELATVLGGRLEASLSAENVFVAEFCASPGTLSEAAESQAGSHPPF